MYTTGRRAVQHGIIEGGAVPIREYGDCGASPRWLLGSTMAPHRSPNAVAPTPSSSNYTINIIDIIIHRTLRPGFQASSQYPGPQHSKVPPPLG